MTYTTISIIYNPNSTGDSAENAEKLRSDLLEAQPKLKVKLLKTRYAGHAKKIAYELSKASLRPLIISASGDGGYSEVVNGVMKAVNEGASPICAVLPSGNANDHSRTIQDGELVESIISNKTKKIDVLKLTISTNNKTKEMYAHSYIGLGITPHIAVELNKNDLNRIKELLVTIKALRRHKPFKLKYSNQIFEYDSVIFANISEMAKMFTISKNSKPDDGLFEIVKLKQKNKFHLLKTITHAATQGLDYSEQVKEFRFEVLGTMPIQLDGEILKLHPKEKITISCMNSVLTTVL